MACESEEWERKREGGGIQSREGEREKGETLVLVLLSLSRCLVDGERSGSHGANATFTEESTTQQENVDI
jgi:hypothetical protein